MNRPSRRRLTTPALSSMLSCLETPAWQTVRQAASELTVAPPRWSSSSIKRIRVGSANTFSIAATSSTDSAARGSMCPAAAGRCFLGWRFISQIQGSEGEKWSPPNLVDEGEHRQNTAQQIKEKAPAAGGGGRGPRSAGGVASAVGEPC